MKTQNRPKLKPAERLVLFQYLDRQAQSACIAGTFNKWHPNSIPMVNDGTGLWTRDLSLLPGRYEYLLVVDGHWKPDPRCEESVENAFGGLNSVLIVRPREGGEPLDRGTEMNVVMSMARQLKLLSEGEPLPVLPTMKIEVGCRAEESQTGGLSAVYSIEAISIRAETMTSVLEGILRSRPVPHWDVNKMNQST